MSKTIIKLADAPKRLRLKKMQIAGFLAHASAKREILLGFYRDESGKIRPVTKSAVEVRRKKVVKHGKQFKGVKPRSRVVKGIKMSEKEYRAFVDYLNNFRIQKFTKSDVEEWLRFREERGTVKPKGIKPPYARCPKCGRPTTKDQDKDGKRVEINCPVHGRVAIYDKGLPSRKQFVHPASKAKYRSINVPGKTEKQAISNFKRSKEGKTAIVVGAVPTIAANHWNIYFNKRTQSKRVFTVSWYENERWFESKVRAVNQKEARTKIKLNHPTARAIRVATLKRRFGNEYRH